MGLCELFGNEISARSTTKHEILRVLCALLGHEKTECDTTSGTTFSGHSWIKISYHMKLFNKIF